MRARRSGLLATAHHSGGFDAGRRPGKAKRTELIRRCAPRPFRGKSNLAWIRKELRRMPLAGHSDGMSSPARLRSV